MQKKRSLAAFTLMEAMVVVAIIGVIAAIGGMRMNDWLGETRAKAGVRNLADLMMLARAEAIRTGDNHIVLFDLDAAGGDLTDTSGQHAASLLIRDVDGDGIVDSGEKIAAVPVDPSGLLRWGSTFAAATSTQAPDDNPDADFPNVDLDFLCCTFTKPDDSDARWVVFQPDGIPRSFSISPFTAGDAMSGSGAVYLTSGSRDYAVVLSALGAVRVHIWNSGSSAWTQ